MGPAGVVELKRGRHPGRPHVHMNHQDAEDFGVRNGDMMKLQVRSPGCSVVLEDVIVRADDNDQAGGAHRHG